jgi:DNA/RNA-binding domain of Phe-tRNA-synthetase-like protein
MKLNYSKDQEIRNLGICSTVVAEVYDVKVDSRNTELESIKSQVLPEILAMTDESILLNLILQSYRNLVRSIGRSPKKFPPSGESLIQNIRRVKQFPSISVAVDCYNLIVSKSFLAIGVHDLDKLDGHIMFRLSKGQEPFTAVGNSKVKYTEAGDFVYADKMRVLAWLDSKDCETVKLSLETKNIVLIIQGTPHTTQEYNYSAMENACELIARFCGGTYCIQVIR